MFFGHSHFLGSGRHNALSSLIILTVSKQILSRLLGKSHFLYDHVIVGRPLDLGKRTEGGSPRRKPWHDTGELRRKEGRERREEERTRAIMAD